MSFSEKYPTVLLICWFLIAIVVLFLDYISGPLIRFPVMYLIPIVLASWQSGLRWGCLFALVLPFIHLLFSQFWQTPFTLFSLIINTLIRIGVFLGFAYLVNKVSIQKQELEKELQTLKGILPICSFCKRIRNDQGSWEHLEHYITNHSEAEFSHGICPECLQKHYSDLLK